jgi:DNA segregation ATPase FtsK/SpoIIIE-like protein
LDTNEEIQHRALSEQESQLSLLPAEIKGPAQQAAEKVAAEEAAAKAPRPPDAVPPESVEPPEEAGLGDDDLPPSTEGDMCQGCSEYKKDQDGRYRCQALDIPDDAPCRLAKQNQQPQNLRQKPSPATQPQEPQGDVESNGLSALANIALKVIKETKRASTSSLQRRLSIGYIKASEVMDELEAAGKIGPADGKNPREILE